MDNFYNEAEKILKRLDDCLALFLVQLQLAGKSDPQDVIFDNQEFLQVMNISKETAQEWRDSGFIGYSQMDNKIYYRLSDIQEVLNENYHPKKK
jgi:hypothetical protein